MKTNGKDNPTESVAGTPLSFWPEPGLPWANAYLNAHPGPIPPTWQLLHLATDTMAPRFPIGCSVIAEPVAQGQPILPGVYVWHTHRTGSNAYLGRLQNKVNPAQNYLILTQDNQPGETICLLEWEQPGFALYRVTFYNSMPAE